MQSGSIQTPTKNGLGGKYLVFPLSKEKYGFEILKVQEIIGVSTITRVPRAHTYIKGVINLRGKIVPVIDLRLKFGMPPLPYDERTCVIVMHITIDEQRIPVGIIVDTVQEVLHFNSNKIESSPDYGESLNSSFIIGMGRTNDDEVVTLLDIDKVMLDSNKGELKKISEG